MQNGAHKEPPEVAEQRFFALPRTSRNQALVISAGRSGDRGVREWEVASGCPLCVADGCYYVFLALACSQPRHEGKRPAYAFRQ
jgi:hypothetical protein